MSISYRDTGDRKWLAAVIGVALGGHPRHSVELPPGERTLDCQLRRLLASAHMQRDFEDGEEAFHDTVLAAAGTGARKNDLLVEAACSTGSLEVAFAIGRGRRSNCFQGAPHCVAPV